MLIFWCLLTIFNLKTSIAQPAWNPNWQCLNAQDSSILYADCPRYVRIAIHYIGFDGFTPTGNHAINPSVFPYCDYTGYDFARDVVNHMNRVLTVNHPQNICNGWFYYSQFMYDENGNQVPNPKYNPLIWGDPDFTLPPAAPPYGFRVALSGVYWLPDTIPTDASGPNDVNFYLHPNCQNPYDTDCTGGVTSTNGCHIFNVGSGKAAGRAGLLLHELGHFLSSNHTWLFNYECPMPYDTELVMGPEGHFQRINNIDEFNNSIDCPFLTRNLYEHIQAEMEDFPDDSIHFFQLTDSLKNAHPEVEECIDVLENLNWEAWTNCQNTIPYYNSSQIALCDPITLDTNYQGQAGSIIIRHNAVGHDDPLPDTQNNSNIGNIFDSKVPKSLQFLISYGDTPEEITNNVMDYSNLAYGGLTPCQIEQIHDYLTTHTNIWFGDNLTITAPPSISNLAVTCNEANHSVISWEGAANSGYIICYSTDFNTPPICDTLLLPPNENGVIITPDLTNAYTNYEFRNLQPNTDYLFTVTAFNTNCQGTDTLFSDSGSINLLTTPNIQHIIEGSPLWINPLDSTQQAIICIEVNPLTGDTLSINPAILQVNDTIYDSTQHVVRWWVNDFLPQDTTLIDDQPLVTTQPGTYTLLLTNTSEQCSACTTFEVTTHEIGVNLFTVEGFICWGNTLTFTNYTLPAIPIESITWYRNGNLLAGETNDTLLLTAPKISIGDNAYVVVVNYTNGCQASDTITGEVKSISTTYQHDHHCTQELPLLLVNDSVDLWYKDGLAIPGAVNDSLWVTEAGEYVAYNALETLETSCKSKSAGYFIYLYDSPVINLGADTALCQNQAPLTLDVGTPPTTLNLYPDGVQTVWNTPDGFTIGQTCTANTTGQYIATTTYTYIYDIDQTHTCTTTDTIQVTINPLPTATISPTPDANGFLCGEYLTELTASGGVAYQWSTGVTTQSILAYFLPYQYTVTVTDANGCQNSTSVIVGYRALADLGADIAVCQDQVPITLSTPTPPTTNTDELEVAYLWNTGATTPAISVTQSGTYNVTVTYTNKFGEQTYTCTATDTIQVTVNPLPTPSIANDNLYDCQTTAATLCVQPQSYDNYYWSTNETSPCITIDQPGTYTLTATTPEGCQNNATYTATDFDLTGYQFTADVVIATNTTWNAASFAQGIMRTKGNIIVQPGVTLTIDNLTLHFADQKGIIVQQGVVNDVPLAGKLLITNSHLTNDICQPTQPWQGIQLHADQTQAQNTPALIDAYHAHLSTQNTTIENAMMGVAAGKTVITQIAPNLQQIEEFGGGIAAIHSTTFKNCAVGVKLHPYQFAAATTIKNSQFMITDPFIASYNNPANSYIGVWLKSINGVAITATTFNNTNPTVFDIEKQGIGVLAVNADLRLGQYYSPIDGANLSCTFTNLSKGIDAYGSANVYNALQIWHNTFTQTRRGITLNGNAYCTAIGNTFTVPQSNSTNNNTYAYWLQNANGCLIANDSIATDNIDIGNHFTFGIVANEIENGSDILDNTFTGVFEAANLFIGQNDNLNITCNSYKDLNIADWRLLDLEDIQNNNVIHTGRLNEQGVCIFDEMLNEPNHNQWHSPTNEMPKAHWHINNASTDPNFSVVVKWDENCPGCEPTDLNGAVNADYYCKSSDDICPPLYNSANGNGGGIGIGSDIGIAAINDTIRQYIAQNNYTNALQWQTVMPNTWYYLSTATSYLQQGNFGQAQNAMNNISNTQLQKWYQLNYELLQDTLDEDAVLDSLTILANYQKGTLASTLAESVLAEHENTLQLRNVGMYNNGKTKNSTIVANNNGLLQIHPNPAKNKVTISYHTPVDDASLVISDITGKIASVIVFESEQITIDTQHLPSGIYIVTLQQNHTALAMVKLVVTK